MLEAYRPPRDGSRRDHQGHRRDRPTALIDQLAFLWESGGWDGRLAPWDAWRVVMGEHPYPDPAALAATPTYGPLDGWLDDPSITDIHLNGPGRELVTRHTGDALDLGMRETWHPAWYPWLVHQLQARGRGVATEVQCYGTADATRPGRQPCLLRYEVALPPLCPHGPIITIRVLRPAQWSLERLVILEMLSPAAAELLACCMRAAVDIVVVGMAGSGKTTLVQALLEVVADQRIVCIEDVPELLTRSERTLHLELAAVARGTFSAMVRTALRMNAGRIVVGEIRGAEAYAVLAAARNGYPILTTVHGDSARHGLHNLIAMALESTETHARTEAVYATINARPIIVVALSRRGGKRQVAEIVEVQRQFGTARPTIEPLYERHDSGALVMLTRPSHALHAQLETAGAIPEEVFP